MLVTLLPIVTLISRVQSVNAPTPRFVMLLGIVILVKMVEYANAWLPMVVTGRPASVAGITTLPPEPVYFVIVIVPLFVE